MLIGQIITSEGKLKASLIINSSQFSDKEDTIEETFHSTEIQLPREKNKQTNNQTLKCRWNKITKLDLNKKEMMEV